VLLKKGWVKIKTKSAKVNNGFGNGSIFYVNKRNTFAGEVTVSINGELKRKRVYGKTKTIVKNKMMELRIQAQNNELNFKNKITLFELANKLIEEQFILEGIKQSSYDRKKETLKSMCELHNTSIQDMTEEQIKRFFISKIEYSQSYINKAYQLLNAVLKEAIRKKIINENPMLALKKPKSKQELIKVRALTITEQQRLLDVLKSEDIRYSEQMLISMFTGMRMGEVNALEVQDIDFTHKTINVCKSVSRGKYGKTVVNKSTKTKAGMRVLAINDGIAQFLKECIGDKEKGLIFISTTNKPVTTNQVNYQYSAALKKYNIIDTTIYGKVDLHSLRHTYATRCIESGMPAKVLQSVLGHTDISITLDTYCDVFQKYSNENISIADEYMSKNNLKIS
jgi:integrase